MLLRDKYYYYKTLILELEKSDFIEWFNMYQRYVYIVVGILLVLFFGPFFLKDIYLKVDEKNMAVQQIKTAINERKKTVNSKDSIDSKLLRFKQLKDDKVLLFFTEKEYNLFSLHLIHAYAKKQNITVTSVVYGKKTILAHKVIKQTLQLVLSGTFYDVVAYIKWLETYENIIHVRNLGLSRVSVDPVEIKGVLDLELYLINE